MYHNLFNSPPILVYIRGLVVFAVTNYTPINVLAPTSLTTCLLRIGSQVRKYDPFKDFPHMLPNSSLYQITLQVGYESVS